MKRYTLSLLIALVALSFTPRPTFVRYYASIKGSNQGQFKAATNSPGGQESQGWMEILSFSMGAANPVNTGQAASSGKQGKATVSSIVITKKPDSFSSLLNISLATNESLDSIVIQTRDDQQRVAKTTVVRNARIKEIKRNGGNEVISLIYEHIEEK